VSQAPGQIFVLSAPSGTGKSTVAEQVRRNLPDLAYSVSHTTRAPRQGERDGVDYHFVSREEFQDLIAAGSMAEYAEIFGNLYGTSAQTLNQVLATGRDLLLDIDILGARQLRDHFPQGIYIFLLPPSRRELERRLRSRGSENQDEVRQRLDRAVQEFAAAQEYSHLVVNDQLDQAVAQVTAIITAESLRTSRRLGAARALLAF
jgi:guanylate kinase